LRHWIQAAFKMTVFTLAIFPVNTYGYRLRGYAEINLRTSYRLMDQAQLESSSFTLSTYFEGAASDLTQLLGSFPSNNLTSSFKNGTPNAANLLFYCILFASLAQDLAQACYGQTSRAPFNQELFSSITLACQTPLPWHQNNDLEMQRIWLSLAGYDLPLTEYLAWRDEFTNDHWIKISRAEWMRSLIVAVFMNPYFLVRN
jgi:hypothetical protein